MNAAFRPTIARLARTRLIQEPHPFFIFPTTQKVAPISWKFFAKRLGNTAVFYVPALGGYFGWMYLAEQGVMASGTLNSKA